MWFFLDLPNLQRESRFSRILARTKQTGHMRPAALVHAPRAPKLMAAACRAQALQPGCTAVAASPPTKGPTIHACEGDRGRSVRLCCWRRKLQEGWRRPPWVPRCSDAALGRELPVAPNPPGAQRFSLEAESGSWHINWETEWGARTRRRTYTTASAG